MKNIKLFFSITAIVIIILCSFTGDKRSTHPTNRIVDDFTEIILNNEEYSLTYNELISYEEQLKKLETGEQNTNDSKQLSIALAYLYYLNGEYDTSLNYFNQAHQIDDSADADLNLLVINGLAKCYMALGDNETSYFYFQHALSLAEQINDDFLAKEIHAFAHTIVSFNEGLEPAILLLENALKLSATPKTNIQNHLYLGSLYIAKQDYKNAVSHTQSGFELATKYKIPELKNSSIKELADLYYIQGKYNQAIILYEELLDGNYALPLKETLDILVYTADSYALIGKFKQAHEQINTFIEFITNEVKLPYSKITKELNWIYLLQTKIYLLQSDAESASFSLQKAFEMYKESPNVMYPNTDIWIEKTNPRFNNFIYRP